MAKESINPPISEKKFDTVDKTEKLQASNKTVASIEQTKFAKAISLRVEESSKIKMGNCIDSANAFLKNEKIKGEPPWMNSKFHPYVDLKVLYMFCEVTTSLWLLFQVQNVLRYLYTCRVQPSLYGNNSSA